MSNERYSFFVSYPRVADKGHYTKLSKFIGKIKEGLISKLKIGEKACFIDENIEPGEDWTEEIKEALRTSYTMIVFCIPTYFERPYCGKEYFIFLRRIHLLEKQLGTKKKLRKIIPIMWEPFTTLQNRGLPPSHLDDFAFKVQDIPIINERGLGPIARRAIKDCDNYFNNYAENIMNMIWKEVINDPLPLYEEPFYYRNVPNAFNKEEFRKVEEGVCAFNLESFGIQDREDQTSNISPQIEEPSNESQKPASAEDRGEELPYLRVPGGTSNEYSG